MSTNINSQVVRSYTPGLDTDTTAYQEIQNQQLNEALKAGTVDGILMSPGYSATQNMNVAVKRDLSNFVTQSEINASINAANFDFGDYAEASTHTLKVKHNSTASSGQRVPQSHQLTQLGEIAVDNYDASIYLLGAAGTAIRKVDAGTVNGFVIERDVTVGGNTGMLNRSEVIDLFDAAFTYNAGANSLTIKVPV